MTERACGESVELGNAHEFVEWHTFIERMRAVRMRAMRDGRDTGAGSRVIESDMSDVLRDMALGGRGVAWLTESTVAAAGRKGLIAIGGDKWSVPLSLVAFKDRMNDQRPLNLFWSELCRHNAGQAGAGRGKPPAKSSARLPVKSSR